MQGQEEMLETNPQKFGTELPKDCKDVDEACRLDEKNCNRLWGGAIDKEQRKHVFFSMADNMLEKKTLLRFMRTCMLLDYRHTEQVACYVASHVY